MNLIYTLPLVYLPLLTCRTSIEKSLSEEFNKEEKVDLQVEVLENDLYNVFLLWNNETFDFNISRQDLDVDVWLADEEENTTISDSEVPTNHP